MKPLSDITDETEGKLKSLGFIQTRGYDEGMRKGFEWSNDTMTIGLYYDRGYFDCNIIPAKEPRTSLPLLGLLKYITNNRGFYDKELQEAGLWNTLPSGGYFKLFFEYYVQIKTLFENYNNESYNEIKQFLERKTPN